MTETLTTAQRSAPPIYDPRDPAVMADPYPAYRRLRAEDPVHWSPVLKAWVVTRYEDVRTVLLDDAMSVDRLMAFYRSLPAGQARVLHDIVHYLNLWVAFRDPPDHTRLRRIMQKAFTAPAVNGMRAAIERIVALLLARLEGRRDIDLVAEYAGLVPAYVIMDLLGVPREMLDRFKAWSDDMASFIGGARNVGDKYERAAHGCREMSGYFRELVEERRRAPREGFLVDLIQARDQNDALTDDELIATCMLVLFAGHETTTNLIGNAVLNLLRHPAQFELFRDDPETTRGTIEEVLRFDGPTNALVRAVARDHELHGVRLREGERVYAMVASANRDPEAFDDPESFDIRRSPNRHLSFGLGIHTCLGAPLAREEGRIAVRAFVERFPKASLIEGQPPQWIDAMVPRGMRHLPVRLEH